MFLLLEFEPIARADFPERHPESLGVADIIYHNRWGIPILVPIRKGMEDASRFSSAWSLYLALA